MRNLNKFNLYTTIDMLKRRIREIGGSLVVSLPKQVCRMFRLQAGDEVEIEITGVGEFRIRKCERSY